MNREQWWEEEIRKEKKVVRSYVRVMTVAAQTRQRMRGDNGLQEVNEQD